jgi:cell wall-associated NlpC family hydrolase
VSGFAITARVIGTTSTSDPDGRYDASLKLTELSVEQGWLSYAHVGLTRGDDFPEAEVIAPYLARDHGVLLFSKSSALTSAAVTALKAHGTDVTLLDMLGLGWSVYRQVKSLNAARVTALSSTSGPVAGGNSLVLTGTSFDAVSKIRVGKVDLAPENWRLDSDTQITILAMPAGFGRGPAEITLFNYWGASPASAKDLYVYLSDEPAVTGDKVVAEALKYLGVPYLWGGASPTSGFDCSGLVMYVYKKFGVSLPHRSLYQANYGTPVSKDDLLPGDLVFFYTPISHVGMYVGGGLMINAPRNGDLVCIEDVFRESYVRARRMLSPYTRYQQTDSRVRYAGKWSTGNSTSASGGSYGYANTSGSSLTVAFDGTQLNWVTKKSPSYGKASVSLDGGAAVEVSLYSSSTLYQQKVWTTSKLPLGQHTVTIRWTGVKGASTGGTNIGADAFDVIGSLIQAPPPLPAPTRYQDTHASLTFTGVWEYSAVSAASGGSLRRLDGDGSVSATFTGTSLSWVARKSPSYGVARVTVDDGEPVLVDLYSPTSDYAKNVWSTGPLEPGTHTNTIEQTGEKNAAATGTGISLDAFDVIGTLVRPSGLARVEQTDSRLVYAGTWYTFSTTGPSSGSYRRANTGGTSVTVKFTGTYLSWIATAGTTLSKAYVSLDDRPAQSIDLARSAVAYQQSVWTTGTIPEGSHTVKIWWDTTNAAGKYISIDAFDVVGTLN